MEIKCLSASTVHPLSRAHQALTSNTEITRDIAILKPNTQNFKNHTAERTASL